MALQKGQKAKLEMQNSETSRNIFHMIITEIYMMISRFQIKSERINSFVKNMKNSPSYLNDFLTTIVLR